MAVAQDAFIGGNADVAGTFHAVQGVTLDSTLSVADAVTLSKDTDATTSTAAAVMIAGGLAVKKAVYIGDKADVAGTLRVGQKSTLAAADVSGILKSTNAANASASDDQTAALSLAGGLAVVQDAYIGGKIDVTGAAAVHNTLDVSGVVTLSNATNATSTSSGAVKIGGGLGVNNAAWIGGLINVAGDATLQQNLSVGSLVAPASLDGAAALAVAGGMTVANDAWMGGVLNVKKEVTFQDNLAVGGNAVISGNLTVNGTTTTVNSQTLDVADAAILVANGNLTDIKDFGVEGQYGVSTYAGFKRVNTTGEFVFFQDATSKIEDGSTGMNYAVVMADSFNCASDARLKKDIYPLESALDKIDSIRGVNYYWRDENQSKERQVGVIAQEIQVVYPELVMEGGNGFLSVDYPKLTAVLIQSIKELKAMVLALAQK